MCELLAFSHGSYSFAQIISDEPFIETQAKFVNLWSASGIRQCVVPLITSTPSATGGPPFCTFERLRQCVSYQNGRRRSFTWKNISMFYWWGGGSKQNKSSPHRVERRTHRHGFGWRWWVENKGFFEHILISNIHGLAAFLYDWTTESLFVCVMKHIKEYVPKLNPLMCMCAHALASMCACLYFTCMYQWCGWVPKFFLADRTSIGRNEEP